MPTEAKLSPTRIAALQRMANRLRRHSLISTTEAGSGHPTSCLSCAEIMAALFFHSLRFDVAHPERLANDRFVLSKGHAAPILWAAWAEAGAFPVERLKTLRRFDSDLEGHPTPRNPLVDVATGSLGQGLSVGTGMAIAMRQDRLPSRVFVLMGDSEAAEGSVWEAAELASHLALDRLIAVVDVNRLGQSGETMHGHDLKRLASQYAAFGWNVSTVDGHDLEAVIGALDAADETRGKPTVVLARTLKGKGVSFLENKPGWHGKPVQKEDLARALAEIDDEAPLPEPLAIAPPSGDTTPRPAAASNAAAAMPAPEYAKGDSVASRKAFGTALRKLGRVEPRVVALDGEVKNSTHSEDFLAEFPDRFVECYIAEQNMVGVGMGLAAMGKIPFASTFACFLSRAYDFIRVAGISRSNLKLCGSHAGVSIGEDGPSQMGLEDIAMMRAVVDSTVLYPSDAVSGERLTALAVSTPGVVYVRTTRAGTPLLYGNDERFEVGGSKTLVSSEGDRATLVAAGITLHEALAAERQLAAEGVAVRVIDLYSVKPVDRETLLRAARETGLIVTVEDHYPEGGIGDAVAMALETVECRRHRLAVRGLSRSGKPAELLDAAGISARHIVEAVKSLVNR